MTGGAQDASDGARPEDPSAKAPRAVPDEAPWPLWEVFVRPRRGLSHVHVGSVHATDERMAMQNARDVYTRRGEGESIWVLPSAQIVASDPDGREAMFDPALDKVYRHPTFYEVPDGVTNM